MSNPYRIVCLAAVVIAAVVGILGVGTLAQTQSPLPKPNPFHLDNTWKMQLPPGAKELGEVVAAEETPDGNLIVLTRCGSRQCVGLQQDPIIKIDKNGKYLKSWGGGAYVWPHGLLIDRDGNVWVTDAVAGPDVKKDDPRIKGKGQVVIKYSPEGKVLMTLGKPGVAGNGPDTFNAPSDVVLGANGDIFVADGHGGQATNERVVKFDKNGKFIKAWGKYGKGPGDFDGPHGITIDEQGRLLVADRGNSRIQVFDQDGKFIAEYKQFGRPSDIAIDRNDVMYVTDTQTLTGRPGFQNGIYIGNAKDGMVTGFIPKIKEHTTSEPGPNGQQLGPGPDRTNMEGVGVSADGNVLYGCEVGLHSVFRFLRNK
jgi:sugar lactone lactonase YvrE